MNKVNASRLWKIVQEAGDYLQNKLPNDSNYPKARNAYAHIALSIKKNLV